MTNTQTDIQTHRTSLLLSIATTHVMTTPSSVHAPHCSQPSPAAAASGESGVLKKVFKDPGAKGTAASSSSTATPASSGVGPDSVAHGGGGGGGGGGADNAMIFQCLVDGLEAQKDRLVARTVER